MIDPKVIASFVKSPPVPERLHLMIPQEGVRHTVLPSEVKHNATWDYIVSPEGRHFLSVCAEGNYSQYAHMYEYLPESGELKLKCLNTNPSPPLLLSFWSRH